MVRDTTPAGMAGAVKPDRLPLDCRYHETDLELRSRGQEGDTTIVLLQLPFTSTKLVTRNMMKHLAVANLTLHLSLSVSKQ